MPGIFTGAWRAIQSASILRRVDPGARNNTIYFSGVE